MYMRGEISGEYLSDCLDAVASVSGSLARGANPCAYGINPRND